MSGYLLCGDTVLRAPGARIPREDVAAFRDSIALLEDAKERRDRATEEVENERANARRVAREEAVAEMRASLAEAVAAVQQGFAAENTRRERETAAAAMEVLEHLIGQRPDAEVMTGLASKALERVGGNGITVRVAPDMVEALGAAMEGREIAIVADAALPPLACRIDTGDGRVVADLDTQLATLRERWGLSGEMSR